jgi:hypothetical protein
MNVAVCKSFMVTPFWLQTRTWSYLLIKVLIRNRTLQKAHFTWFWASKGIIPRILRDVEPCHNFLSQTLCTPIFAIWIIYPSFRPLFTKPTPFTYCNHLSLTSSVDHGPTMADRMRSKSHWLTPVTSFSNHRSTIVQPHTPCVVDYSPPFFKMAAKETKVVFWHGILPKRTNNMVNSFSLETPLTQKGFSVSNKIF